MIRGIIIGKIKGFNIKINNKVKKGDIIINSSDLSDFQEKVSVFDELHT